MEIRPAAVTDVADIAEVHRLSRADYYGSSPDENDGREVMWAHFLNESDRATYVEETSGQVEAVMSVRRLTHPEAVFELTAIYVHPERFGRGIGSRLHQVFEDGRADDVSALLEVWEGNSRAVRFYERRGWIRTDVTRPGPQEIPFVTYRLMARNPAG